jgi:hypothetical protein
MPNKNKLQDGSLMNSDNEKKRIKEISKMLSTSVIFFMAIVLSTHYEDKHPSTGILSPGTIAFLLGFGYVHLRFSDIMAYLYNLNRFGPRTTPQKNKILGIVLLVATGVYCIGLFALKWL